jgi:hypothetical protein
MWTGLALGTALAVLAMVDGVRLRIGGTPPLIGWFLGGLLVWMLVVGAATGVAELLRRHHRAIGRYAGRQAGHGARRSLRFAHRHGRRGVDAASRWADRRWATRQSDPEPVQACGPSGPGLVLRPPWQWRRRQAADGTQQFTDPEPTPADGLPAVPPADPAGSATGGDGTWSTPDPARHYGTGPWIIAVRHRDGRPYYEGPDGSQVGTAVVQLPEDLRRRLEAAATDPDTEVRVTRAKVTDPDLEGDPARTGASGGSVPPADRNTNQHGGTNMTTAMTDNQPVDYWPNYYAGNGARRAPGLPRRTARTATAPEPNGPWKPLISSTNGFEPENDAHLLGWMAGEAGGMSGYAEEIADVYETAVNTIGLDPVAMAALHDYADAAATAAEAMAKARQRFADHYAEVRAFAANGGVLPYNGRWMTGEGD